MVRWASRRWIACAAVAASIAVAGCSLFGRKLERPPRTAETVGVVASVSADLRDIRLVDGKTVRGDGPNQFINGNNAVGPGDLLFAGSAPQPWLAFLVNRRDCPQTAPFSGGAIAWTGDTYVDFAFGLRVPQAPGFGRHGEPIKPGTMLDGPVCVDAQGRAVEFLGGGA